MSAEEYVRISKRTGKPIAMCNGCGFAKRACKCLEISMRTQIVRVGLPEPETEIVFAPPRKWRFDLGWPDRMIAIECEGGTFVGGAHGRGKHYESDCEKYAEAVIRGWRVLRFTTDMIKDGRAITLIERALSGEGLPRNDPDQTSAAA